MNNKYIYLFGLLVYSSSNIRKVQNRLVSLDWIKFLHNLFFALRSVAGYNWSTVLTKFYVLQFRRATRLGRVRVLIREFAGDVCSLWKYGAPFPTFLKLIGTLILCLIVLLPLIYPFFIIIITYFTYESLYLR